MEHIERFYNRLFHDIWWHWWQQNPYHKPAAEWYHNLLNCESFNFFYLHIIKILKESRFPNRTFQKHFEDYAFTFDGSIIDVSRFLIPEFQASSQI